MDSQNITITINNEPCSGQKLVTSSHIISNIGVVVPNLTIDKQAPKQNNLTTYKYLKFTKSSTPSPMPALPYPPKHKHRSAWKKTPPIPKLTLETGPETIKLSWDDGISLGSYCRYAAIAGYELFACVLEDSTNEAKWEYLTFLRNNQPNYYRRQSVTCEMTDLVTGIEYYFAVRSVDVHDRRGPCAVEYAQL